MYDPLAEYARAVPVQRSLSPSCSAKPYVVTVGADHGATAQARADAQHPPGQQNTNRAADGIASGVWRETAAGTVPPRYFDDIYDKSLDPWNFETSEYEAEKYHHTLASLPRARYARALEIGCSIGVLTHQLASRCDELLGVDVSERALAIARQRCANLPQVNFDRIQVPVEMPEGPFDLVVLSEVVYFWQREDLERAANLLIERQSSRAHLILVHYTPPVPDYPLTGDQVHDAWLARPEWKLLRQERRESYRLDVLEKKA